MTHTQAYQQLIAALRQISLLDSIGSLLGWDERTYLPPRGAAHRADQLGLVVRMSHEQFTAPGIDELLRAVEGSELMQQQDSDAAVNVRETRRLYDRARKLPASLVEEMAKVAVLAQQAWATAKQKSDFAGFQPWLDKTLHLKRQEAQCVGYESNPYDALLDAYEPRETAATVQVVFEALRPRLVDLVGQVASSGRKAPVHILNRNFPIELQQKLSREAATAFGFDFDAGRLDLTVHPFCSGMGPGDTRITTRYDEHNFADGLFSVLHETGHALYEQGLPKAEHFGLPVGESVSLGIHESQSRMWENLVGRSRAFWRFMFPKAKALFADVLDDVTEDDLIFAINDIRPSLIRVDADECTYNLHIMLRFELEQAMLRDQLKPADLPAVWNEKMKQYLGIAPPDDAHGCLQDIHWSGGAIGYFPTYSLGNLYAAQFFEQARKDLGDLDAMFARGEFAPLLTWLRQKIHRHGKRCTARQLVQRVTGSDLSAEPLMRHLTRKAQEFYGV